MATIVVCTLWSVRSVWLSCTKRKATSRIVVVKKNGEGGGQRRRERERGKESNQNCVRSRCVILTVFIFLFGFKIKKKMISKNKSAMVPCAHTAIRYVSISIKFEGWEYENEKKNENYLIC